MSFQPDKRYHRSLVTGPQDIDVPLGDFDTDIRQTRARLEAGQLLSLNGLEWRFAGFLAISQRPFHYNCKGAEGPTLFVNLGEDEACLPYAEDIANAEPVSRPGLDQEFIVVDPLAATHRFMHLLPRAGNVFGGAIMSLETTPHQLCETAGAHSGTPTLSVARFSLAAISAQAQPAAS